MNAKITLVELTQLMAESTSTTKRVCELFLRELFATISQALIEGESVKIKGIGTFKVTEVKPRKSVSVQSGKSIEVKGYSRITFTPTKALAAAVNQPFEQFETVYLHDEVSDEKLAEIDERYPSILPEDTVEVPAAQEEPSGVEQLAAAPNQNNDSADNLDVPSTTEVEPQPVPDPVRPTVIEEPVGQKALAAFGVPVEHEPAPEPERAPEKPARLGPLMGIPIDGPSTPEPEAVAAKPVPEPEPEPEPDEEDHFYRPAPRNIFTPTKEQISRQQSLNERRHLWPWLIAALVAVGVLGYVFTRCGGPSDSQQAAVVANSDTIEAAVEEPQVITDTVTAQIVLVTLSEKYYGSPWFWVYIYEENKDIISNPNNVRPGTEVVIPPAEKYGIDANDPASLKKAQRLSWELLKGR